MDTDKHRLKYAFTIVELLIVAAILGILAAFVTTIVQDHVTKAKESTAKENLFTLRDAIGRYAAQHGGIPPGYLNDDTDSTPNTMLVGRQLTVFEHYLSAMPKNPFNELTAIKVLGNNETFPTGPIQTDTYGWLYKPAIKTIKLNWSGTDSTDLAYFDY